MIYVITGIFARTVLQRDALTRRSYHAAACSSRCTPRCSYSAPQIFFPELFGHNPWA